ncbi:MAG: hypothetical protein ACP5N2_05335 [Candidatus Nanoarchaeia archaeon]
MINLESTSKQIINGTLVFPQNNCLYVALQAYKSRHLKDTNPLIVKMILTTDIFKEIDHWYYRSDQWIEQPFLIPKDNIPYHIGPIDSADKRCYTLFEEYTELMNMLPASIDKLLEKIPKEISY